jgi:hypothetical protein
VNQVEVAPVALDAEPGDLHQHQLEIFEQAAQSRVLCRGGIHQQSRRNEKVCCFAGEARITLFGAGRGGE